MRNKRLVSYRVFLYGFIVFSLYFGAPIFGVINFKSFITETVGCPDFHFFSETHPCIVLGIEISPRFFLYKMPVANILATPVAFLIMFFELVVLWLICIFSFKYMSTREYRNTSGKKANKFKNVNASEAGSDAAETRRPF